MRGAMLAAVVVAALALLWLAGEAHRENCIRQHRADCSVLPWQSGSETGPAVNPFDK